MCYWLIDIRGYKAGHDRLLFLDQTQLRLCVIQPNGPGVDFWWKVPGPEGTPIALKTFLYNILFSILAGSDELLAVVGVCYILIWFGLAIILYKKKIFIKL
jgi:hypothetical protein